ncbi:MAG: YmdB family metallophosphoesterase, partial [Alphaproteobacteria bacterium]
MKLLFCGDIVGRSGRAAVTRHLPGLRRLLGLDFVVGNGENAAAGFGITPKVAAELHDAGIDVITTGNHAFDQREIIPYMDTDSRILRPANYPPGTPGRGAVLTKTAGGRAVLVIQVMTRLFMEALDDPFRVVEDTLAAHEMGRTVDAV